jgi:hypothetical protein
MQLFLQLNYSELDYILYLDNLFVLKALAKAFREYFIGTIGIIRKNTKGISRELFELKQNNIDLIWGSVVNRINERVYFVFW